MEKVTIFYCGNYDGKSSASLLLKAASILLPKDAVPIVSKKNNGKPWFENYPSLHFSISHSKSVWICAFSNIEVGCDIQFHINVPQYERIAKRYFHPDEIKCMTESEAPSAEFFRIWSRKEAACKYTGEGIGALSSSVNTKAMIDGHEGIYLKDLSLPCKEPYSAAIVCEREFEYKLRFID